MNEANTNLKDFVYLIFFYLILDIVRFMVKVTLCTYKRRVLNALDSPSVNRPGRTRPNLAVTATPRSYHCLLSKLLSAVNTASKRLSNEG